MEKQFELMLPKTWRLLALGFSGLGLIFAGSIRLLDWLELSKGADITAFVLLILGGGYGLWRLLQRIGGDPTLVTIGHDKLVVLNRRSGDERRIDFADIASYRFMAFNAAEELRLTLQDGSRMKLATNTNLYSSQNFMGMVQAFEVALEQYQQHAGRVAATLREKTFFEKPIGKLFSLLHAVGIAVISGQILSKGQSWAYVIMGVVMLALSGFMLWLVIRSMLRE
ncbi:MAG TPA: hypothetical protein V6D04_12230 [Candidatus Obscuribacterales bacterium]